ncbi:MAG: gamma-glutamyl-gamma-aminobutyrate hydrolase family protein [Actinomycetota bacterium]
MISALDTTEGSRRAPSGHVVVVGQWRKGHARLPLSYARAVAAAGGAPRIFSTFELVPTEDAPRDLDVTTGVDPLDPSSLEGAVGLVLPGGGDIDPALYGAELHPKTKNVSERRDRYELTLLDEALRRDLPVLAICHGMQLLNVHLGGTLDQHLADRPGRLEHDTGRPAPTPAHDVDLAGSDLLAEALGSTRVAVNTSHHQGLLDVAPELEEVAWAPDGVLEGVVATGYSWVVGVQWHPEAMVEHDPTQLRLFEAFVDASRAYAGRTPEWVTARSA